MKTPITIGAVLAAIWLCACVPKEHAAGETNDSEPDVKKTPPKFSPNWDDWVEVDHYSGPSQSAAIEMCSPQRKVDGAYRFHLDPDGETRRGAGLKLDRKSVVKAMQESPPGDGVECTECLDSCIGRIYLHGFKSGEEAWACSVYESR